MSSAPIGDEVDVAVKRSGLDVALVPVLVVATVVRFFRIGSQSLWYDELATASVVDRPLTQVLDALSRDEGTPPLYYLLLWVWTRLLGSGDMVLRSFSALAGVAAVVVVCAIARELGFTRRMVRIATLLAAVNPVMVWYSQEVRAYSLFILFGALSILLMLRVQRSRSTVDLYSWAACCVAAVATHYFAVVLVFGEVVLLLHGRRLPVRRVLVGAMPTLVTVALLVPLALQQRSTDKQSWIGEWPLGFRSEAAVRHLLVGPGSPNDVFWVVVAATCGLGVLLLAGARDRTIRANGARMLGLAIVIVLVPIVPAIVGYDYFLDRNVVVVVVPFMLAVAAGLGSRTFSSIGSAAVGVLVVVSVVVVGSAALDPTLHRVDWRGLAAGVDGADGVDGSSLVVMANYRNTGLPMLRYLDDAVEWPRDLPVEVSAIDVLWHAPQPHRPTCSWWFGQGCGLIFLGITELPPGMADHFELADTHRKGEVMVKRYVADRPTTVYPGDLVGPGVSPLFIVTDPPF